MWSSLTAQRSTQVSAATVTSKNNKSGFTLAIWQPAGNLSEVIARVSIKGKRNQGYFKERFIGDYKYKIQQKAKFVKGLKSGDRVVVRLYDLENRFLGYSEFECLQTNSAVNLILSENPSQYKVVRTVYGADANFDGNVDTGSTTYDYFTQVDNGLSSTVGDRQVTFLSSSRQINISQFQVAGVSAVATKSVYPNSFTQGKYAVVRKSMSIFSSTQAAALQAVPGQLVQIKEVDSDSSFDVSQLMMAYREVGVARNIQVKFSDVASNHWAQDFIAELAALEIIEGFPNGTFRPDEQVNRAQFAAMLSQAFEKVKVRNALKFKDVSSNFWAYSAIREAYEMGFLGIIDSEFKPTQELSRLEVLIALAKGLNYTVTGSTERILTAYTDATSIRSDVRSAIAALTERGIVVNYPNVQSLNPGKVATRAEVSALIYKALVSTGTVTDISSEYTVGKSAEQAAVEEENETKTRRHCNQGIGNGSEGCDPGNSRPHGGSNDETGRTPGNKK
ncbi:S-layer homology domain-containing protein [Calothrix sp. 336/3]|uniref:S-layer homology domain-containing protein n=1 Tax=Calothrix sp. 336/3 TaxID=1337936 RepID=UPI00069B0FDC|nr:S-layer homology domain-containing protein [Calothrix sp. 336/3]